MNQLPSIAQVAHRLKHDPDPKTGLRHTVLLVFNINGELRVSAKCTLRGCGCTVFYDAQKVEKDGKQWIQVTMPIED
ncbi:MAG: hypothetical protein HXX08_11270 [Chloroflexi bacterium]|uniref:Uncharacterized protein n=1 Tax=Candidatus Chlorohelix allophototropha TaxID=3003348 RepID=A0A8T7M280_9CHLR|nr:hypothetical protein [Chloroflexota bacterium]WJW65817.1 hypothetical protein OZ401_001596 [Chloroflexota bacterium L227-S17]